MPFSRTLPSLPAKSRTSVFSRFHSNEQGDEGVNKILIIAFVAIPLIIVIILFGGKIKGWFTTSTNAISNETNTINDTK